MNVKYHLTFLFYNNSNFFFFVEYLDFTQLEAPIKTYLENLQVDDVAKIFVELNTEAIKKNIIRIIFHSSIYDDKTKTLISKLFSHLIKEKKIEFGSKDFKQTILTLISLLPQLLKEKENFDRNISNIAFFLCNFIIFDTFGLNFNILKELKIIKELGEDEFGAAANLLAETYKNLKKKDNNKFQQMYEKHFIYPFPFLKGRPGEDLLVKFIQHHNLNPPIEKRSARIQTYQSLKAKKDSEFIVNRLKENFPILKIDSPNFCADVFSGFYDYLNFIKANKDISFNSVWESHHQIIYRFRMERGESSINLLNYAVSLCIEDFNTCKKIIFLSYFILISFFFLKLY